MRPIPKVTAVIPLNEYAEDFGEETVRVWLNPSLELVNRRGAMLRESAKLMAPGAATEEKTDELNEQMFVWLADVLDGMTLAEIHVAYKQSPDFVMWLVTRATRLMDEHRAHKKKASTTR